MVKILSKIKTSLNLVLSAAKIGNGLAKISAMLKRGTKITIEDFENLLISSDMGLETSQMLAAQVAKYNYKDIKDIKIKLKEMVVKILEPVSMPIALQPGKETVIVLCGVNGNGKTTTAGKLANHYTQNGKKVIMAAADTFRAAAKEQLTIWANKVECALITGKEKSDPASVAYTAMAKAKKDHHDILIIDTAGRLHNQVNFMQELQKIVNTIKKKEESAPHHIIMVIDATTGQNAFTQVEQFGNMVDVTGVIMTKVDGSAKGGIIVGLAHKYPYIKIHYLGHGERIEDLVQFNPEEFALNLLDMEH